MNLILVHGFLGTGLNFAPIVQRLKAYPQLASWNFVAPDLLSHGQKWDLKGQQLTLDAIAQDLESEWPEGPTIALGHSFGLRPLLRIVSRKPGRALALIAEDSTPGISEPGYRDLRRIFDTVPTSFPSRPAAKEGLEAIFGKESRMSRFLMTNIREMSPGVHTWRFNREELSRLLDDSKAETLWSEWSGYPGPIIMMAGGTSSFVEGEKLQECVDRRPNLDTQVVQIPGAGHWVHADQPELFTESLVKVLERFLD